MPSASRIGTIGHLRKKPRLIGMSASGERVRIAENDLRRTVKANHCTAFPSRPQAPLHSIRRLAGAVQIVGVKRRIEMQADLVAEIGENSQRSASARRKHIVHFGPTKNEIARDHAKALLDLRDRQRRFE